MENKSNSTLFIYSIIFSNSTATVSITINNTNNLIILSFTSNYIINFITKHFYLKLNTLNSLIPYFKYINNSSIYFKYISNI